MAQAQQQSRTRRLSITALGLSGSPTRGQPVSPFGSLRDRGKSVSDNPIASSDDGESAIAEDSEAAIGGSNSLGSMGRRMSAGAKAYADQRRSLSGSNSGAVAASSTTGTSPDAAGRVAGSPPGASKGKCKCQSLPFRCYLSLTMDQSVAEGFNWGDSLRTRAERQSISSASTQPRSFGAGHMRTPSQSEPQAVPVQPAPKPVQAKPDHFQERILKGDFYMD